MVHALAKQAWLGRVGRRGDLFGDADADRLRIRDGLADSATCGDGADDVDADPEGTDTVDADCEAVTRS